MRVAVGGAVLVAAASAGASVRIRAWRRRAESARSGVASTGSAVVRPAVGAQRHLAVADAIALVRLRRAATAIGCAAGGARRIALAAAASVAFPVGAARRRCLSDADPVRVGERRANQRAGAVAAQVARHARSTASCRAAHVVDALADVHSAFPLHDAPFPFGPQDPGLTLVLHVFGGEHWVLSVQEP